MGLFLPEAWRFIVYNKNTGVTLDFSSNGTNEKAEAIYKTAKGDGSGGASHSASSTDAASTDLGNASVETLGTGKTGETNVDVYGTFHVETDNTSASGDVLLLMEWSADGTTTWPSDATDFDPDLHAIRLATINLSGAQSKTRTFSN